MQEKTEATCFHFNNKLTNKEVEVYFEGNLLKHNKNPKYLSNLAAKLTLGTTLFKNYEVLPEVLQQIL